MKRGFTLAEVIITLGVVGVLAALTIPVLITQVEKRQTANRLRLVFSQITQAVERSEFDNEDITSWMFSGKPANENFENYLAKYMIINEIPELITLNTSGIKYMEISGNQETSLRVVKTPGYFYTLPNGTELFVTSRVITSGGIGILIDLNGHKSPPNQFGKDTFYGVISTNYRRRFHLPGSFSDSEVTFESEPNGNRDVLIGKKKPVKGDKYRYSCSKSGRGLWCGRLIQVDGWSIAKDYPW